MYAWFIQGAHPRTAMIELFMNPKCNLHEYWEMGHVDLQFRHIMSALPLCGGKGTLISDTPFDTFLYPKGHPLQGEMQYDWSPFVITIAGKGKMEGIAWIGVHRAMVEKTKINIPTLKEMHDRNQRKIQIAS